MESEIDICRAHRRPKPCVSCASCSVAQREVWKTKKRQQQHLNAMVRRDDWWSKDEIDVLKKWAGLLPSSEIAFECTKHSGVFRRKHSVEAKAVEQGISLLRTGHSLIRVANIFGMSAVTMAAWRDLGYIGGRKWGVMWVFHADDIDAFIRAYPWAYDVDRMQPGRYRNLAEVIQRRNPWLRVPEAAQAAGISIHSVWDRIYKGEIQVKRRTGHNGAVMINHADVVWLRDSVRTGLANSRERLLEINHGRKKIVA